MRVTKVYTRTGDKGTTALADGSRIGKDSLRLESYGTIDELNSVIGICLQNTQEISEEQALQINYWLSAIQNDLFNLGSDLATPIASRWKNMILINEADILQLEKLIDYCQLSLEPLKEFVLPGGTLLNSYLHFARTVCRRAERFIVSLAKEEEINNFALIYINRLSDLFFVLARWVQRVSAKSEMTWNKSLGVRSLKI
ncbi:cob(I)yrinic acid a,c-diamide adenosyltransferase [Fluviispira sanaruensis]|uniref:Corrinoid adenosyltransferase n=1 Tax=Fluviispira sanaruensis TaxID=2493639 RepID=A0A4P2VRE5_FLUSA|nr:cob(I)yrinic acid a,c-diamide adenosyltransferase [Fluviispira sanaruensis]BBH51615.1 ATP:cob(I)alamin adenosyltransferase [Fluviispira sanaruensis]